MTTRTLGVPAATLQTLLPKTYQESFLEGRKATLIQFAKYGGAVVVVSAIFGAVAGLLAVQGGTIPTVAAGITGTVAAVGLTYFVVKSVQVGRKIHKMRQECKRLRGAEIPLGDVVGLMKRRTVSRKKVADVLNILSQRHQLVDFTFQAIQEPNVSTHLDRHFTQHPEDLARYVLAAPGHQNYVSQTYHNFSAGQQVSFTLTLEQSTKGLEDFEEIYRINMKVRTAIGGACDEAFEKLMHVAQRRVGDGSRAEKMSNHDAGFIRMLRMDARFQPLLDEHAAVFSRLSSALENF